MDLKKYEKYEIITYVTRSSSGKRTKKDILHLWFCGFFLMFVHMLEWVGVEVCVCARAHKFACMWHYTCVCICACVSIHCVHACTGIIHMRSGWYLHFHFKQYFNYDISSYAGFLWILPCFLISALGILTTARMKLYLGALAASNQQWLPFPRGLERFVRP